MCPRSGWSLRPFAEPGRRHLTSPFVVLRLLSSSFCVHHLVAAFTWIFISLLLLLLLLRFWQAALCSKLVTSMQPERPTKKSPRSMSGGPFFFVCNFSKKKKKGGKKLPPLFCRHFRLPPAQPSWNIFCFLQKPAPAPSVEALNMEIYLPPFSSKKKKN